MKCTPSLREERHLELLAVYSSAVIILCPLSPLCGRRHQDDDGEDRSTANRKNKKPGQLLPAPLRRHREGGRLLRPRLGRVQVSERMGVSYTTPHHHGTIICRCYLSRTVLYTRRKSLPLVGSKQTFACKLCIYLEALCFLFPCPKQTIRAINVQQRRPAYHTLPHSRGLTEIITLRYTKQGLGMRDPTRLPHHLHGPIPPTPPALRCFVLRNTYISSCVSNSPPIIHSIIF